MIIEKIDKQPDEITPIYVNAVLMPQGEIICLGKTVGWLKDLINYTYIEKKNNNISLEIHNLIEQNGYEVFGSDTTHNGHNAFLLQIKKDKKPVGEVIIDWHESITTPND